MDFSSFPVRRASLSEEQSRLLSARFPLADMTPTVEILPPSHPAVLRAPARYRPLDELVAEFGTRFHRYDADFDITADVEGRLGQGLVAALVFVSRDEAPQPIPPELSELLSPPPSEP